MKEGKESSNNKRTILLALIAVIALMVIVGGATFAFFATTRDINASTPVNTQTAASMYSFSATANENIEFNLSASEMSEANVNRNVLKSDNANIYMEVASATDEETTTCTYDIQWVWDSADKYTESDVNLPYVESWKTYPYELSVSVDGMDETDLSNLTWNGNKAIVAEGLVIRSTGKAPVKVTHNIEVKSYNIPVDQQKLYNKSFRAHLEIVNNSCEAVTGFEEQTLASIEATGGILSDSIISAAGQSNDSVVSNSRLYSGAIVNENGIRYEGKNPNNYVKFNNELWRIIGVFDENTHGRSGEQLVKIVRAEALPYYYQWDKNNTNKWNSSSMYITLEEYDSPNNYTACINKNETTCTSTTVKGVNIYAMTNEVQKFMRQVDWKIGGLNTPTATASDFYTAERSTNAPSGSTATTWSLGVGLMYPSDFAYGVQASDCARSITLDTYNSTPACINNNWISSISKDPIWTMTPNNENNNSAFTINNGNLESNSTLYTASVIPATYLDAGVKVIEGNGTIKSPYVLDFITGGQPGPSMPVLPPIEL